MALTYTSTNGLFTRIGRLFAFSKQLREERAGVRTNYDSTMATFASNASRDLTPNLTAGIRGFEQYNDPLVGAIARDSALTVVEMVDAETKMEAYSIDAALLNLSRLMLADSKTIARTNTSGTQGYVSVPGSGTTLGRGTDAKSGGNAGNGIFVVYAMSPVRNMTNATVFDMPSVKSETIRTTVIADANTQNVLQRQEVYQVEGERSVPNFHEEWPKGSGIKALGRGVGANYDHGSTTSKNVCANSDFEEFESNIPVRWTRVTGTAGTHIELVADPYIGTNALKLSGDGSTNPNIKQNLDDQTASAGRIHPDCAYTICAAVKRNATAPAVSLIISLRDASNNILNSEVAGRACNLVVETGDIGTSFALFHQCVFTPSEVPAGCYIDIRFSGNVANNSEITVDELTIAKMDQAAPGTPYYQLISGSTPFLQQDEFTTAVTNRIVVGSSGGGTTSDGELALEFERFFGLGSRGIVLPSATGENIADSVIDYTLA